MIQKEAIDKLISTGNAPLFLEQLKTADTQSQLIALPKEYSITDLECYQEHRNNLRGSFSTNIIEEFIEYAKVYAKTEGSAVFVETERMRGVAIFDIGTEEKPLHLNHSASIELKKTAPYQTLLGANKNVMDQRSLAEWIEDYGDYLTPYGAGGAAIEVKKAIEAIRILKFERTTGSDREVQQFAASQSEYERVATKTKEDLQIPAGFVFKCVPYLDLEERRFDMRLSIIRNERLILTIKRLEEIQEEITIEFKDKLVEAQKAGGITAPVYVGTFSGQ